ncbi:MAG TPA: hypothetical protein P5179_06860 [Candidatus Latescibacteria bacterium]|nr:hypothetical protein [Candidatus Latescibacterota bacterium]HPC44609.1 hypothetical protein [Candidatus Latescibacterota bacterium]HPK75699.1 hypothetical protein [Candidatus Latescibacterota bacterium]HRS94972.1 hypothetical protein [Candidatus Latescibacterota bacterium]HRU24400.1 hypothetical protein [Candidatus Latescibacterota bacterium]
MNVFAHPMPEVYGDCADIRAITHDRTQSQKWISTTSTLFNPNDGLTYVGLTHLGGDLLWAYDPATGKSRSCGYLEIRGENEVKIHRSLELGPDGRIYGATAGLTDVKARLTSPGGQIWAYDPRTGVFESFGIPVPNDYVQHVTFDWKRRMAYGCTYPVPWFFAYDLEARETVFSAFTGALPHRSAVDRNGRVWSGYTNTADISGENFLFFYDPDANALTWTDLHIPKCGQADKMQVDDMVALADGFVYVASVDGVLARLDPDAHEIEWLGKPARGMRMCGIGEGPDGLVYCLTGAFYGMPKEDRPTRVFAFDRSTKQFRELGQIFDPEFGDGCAVVHHLSIAPDGTLWVGETDNDQRSGCLWECRP